MKKIKTACLAGWGKKRGELEYKITRATDRVWAEGERQRLGVGRRGWQRK